MDEHDIEWRCGCGHTNPDFDERCRGCEEERYPDQLPAARVERHRENHRAPGTAERIELADGEFKL